MRKFFAFLSGTLTGAAVGAVMALLLAPAPGEELREQALQRMASLRQEIREAAAARRAELEAELARLRGQGTSLAE
ncbi:MAG TPA: YtxH domain-containing protein [Anaerolineae bacterium]|nr:YtxH domain-containing protein [Anaerolineae bacterium]HID85593.1 YtxH domain-containing protein [Anaerolineales bacterium]HIQ09133.1 YtxH domain-containing protein [Anaerolineaceae bacterium]